MDKYRLADDDNPLKRSLMELTLRFEDSKFARDYDGMADAIESIKSKIKAKAISAGSKNKDSIKRVEQILSWYRNKEINYSYVMPDGSRSVMYPSDMPKKINANLTSAYERLVQQMEKLELI